MRRRIFEIIELAKSEKNTASIVYDYVMMVIIVVSLVPLAIKEDIAILQVIDNCAVVIFIIDYVLRWITADIKFEKGVLSFLKYPFSFMALVDLISILPYLTVMNAGFKALRLLRFIRTLRVFRVFKIVRYSKNIQIILKVLKTSRDGLLTVAVLAIGYILVSALIILNVEPDSFNDYFEAVYWATISLTTMGYGDVYPVTTFGRLITMLSSFIGIAIVALPAGIVTAGYMKAMEEEGM